LRRTSRSVCVCVCVCGQCGAHVVHGSGWGTRGYAPWVLGGCPQPQPQPQWSSRRWGRAVSDGGHQTTADSNVVAHAAVAPLLQRWPSIRRPPPSAPASRTVHVCSAAPAADPHSATSTLVAVSVDVATPVSSTGDGRRRGARGRSFGARDAPGAPARSAPSEPAQRARRSSLRAGARPPLALMNGQTLPRLGRARLRYELHTTVVVRVRSASHRAVRTRGARWRWERVGGDRWARDARGCVRGACTQWRGAWVVDGRR